MIGTALNSPQPRLYPTFKEWKQKGIYQTVMDVQVYILPLRNENILGKFNQGQFQMFISYL